MSPARVGSLLRWFVRGKRPLPWRRPRPRPYEVWISEVMLQQTTVATALPYYRRFLRQFPGVRRLAAARIHDVLKAWEGLGYYRRAHCLHRAARLLARGPRRWPRTRAEWRALPGVGDYTAAAIASIAFGDPVASVDGNVLRVMSRFLGIGAAVPASRRRRRIEDALSEVLPRDKPGDFNQALMEVGALVCRPVSPRCEACPLAADCAARRRGWAHAVALGRKRGPLPHVDVVAAVIRRGDRVLIARRRAGAMLGGLWEFPGGKCRSRETFPAALRRELLEETGLRIRVGREMCAVRHAFSHFRMTLHAFECRPGAGRARALQNDGVRWVRCRDLRRHAFPAADHRILDILDPRRE